MVMIDAKLFNRSARFTLRSVSALNLEYIGNRRMVPASDPTRGAPRSRIIAPLGEETKIAPIATLSAPLLIWMLRITQLADDLLDSAAREQSGNTSYATGLALGQRTLWVPGLVSCKSTQVPRLTVLDLKLHKCVRLSMVGAPAQVGMCRPAVGASCRRVALPVNRALHLGVGFLFAAPGTCARLRSPIELIRSFVTVQLNTGPVYPSWKPVNRVRFSVVLTPASIRIARPAAIADQWNRAGAAQLPAHLSTGSILVAPGAPVDRQLAHCWRTASGGAVSTSGESGEAPVVLY